MFLFIYLFLFFLVPFICFGDLSQARNSFHNQSCLGRLSMAFSHNSLFLHLELLTYQNREKKGLIGEVLSY